MAFDSSKASGKVFKVFLAVVLAVALIPISALFDASKSVSALESEGTPVAILAEDPSGAANLTESENGAGVAEPSGGEGINEVEGNQAAPSAEAEDALSSNEGIEGDPVEPFDEGDEGGSVELSDEGAAEAESLENDAQGVEPSEDELPAVEAEADADEADVADDADAEELATSEVRFEVRGEGRLQIIAESGEEYLLADGEDLLLEQQVGTFVVMRGLPSEGFDLDAVVKTLDAQTQTKVGEDQRFDDAAFEKELTFSPSSKVVEVVFEEQVLEDAEIIQPLALMRSFSLRSAQAGNASQPEVGDRFSGSASVKSRNIVSAGGRVADITVDPTSGILAELSGLTTYCAHHTAAAPLVGFTYSYTFTVTSVNKETGEVRGTFYGVSNTSPTDGVSRDSRGRLTGYQALEGEAILWRTYAHGGISISKSLEGGPTSQLEGIAFEIYDQGGSKKSFPLPDGSVTDRLVLDENGRAQTASNALLAGRYSVVEVESTVPEGVISYAKAQGMGSNVVAEVEIVNHQALYPVEVVNYAKPQLALVKVDGDSLREAQDSEAAPMPVAGSVWALERKSGSDWVEVERHETDEAGGISFSPDAISQWGDYRLVEVEPAQFDSPDGYMSRLDSHGSNYVEFAIGADTWTQAAGGATTGQAGDSWEYSVQDGVVTLVHTAANWHYRDLEVIKLDEQTGDPLSQTAYELWRYLGEGKPAEADRAEQSHDVFLTDPSSELDPALWELVDQGETDDQGSILFRGLSFGYYLVVEKLPNPAYAEWWESSESSWGSYCIEVGEAEQKQVQTFENLKITLETTVSKSTIAKTSAAFRSLPGQNVSFDNVGVEQYRYDIAFSNGGTNVRADQYSVVDQCDFTDLGMRLESLWTPVVTTDTDGKFNLWFKTNLTDDQTSYSAASATATNPENLRADGSDRISTLGWQLWSEGLATQSRTQLNVADLGLAEGEHITGLLLEYGSVEVGFETKSPLTYLVCATEQLMGDEVIYNSVSSHITRNWRAGEDGGNPDGLYDDAYDQVQTTVLETMSYEPSESTWVASSVILSQTGDEGALLAMGLGCVAAVGAFAAAFALWRRRANAKADRV